MATETTLVEELLAQAAWRERNCAFNHGCLNECSAVAARLRARAAIVKDAMDRPRWLQTHWDDRAQRHTIRLVDVDALCGPLGAATREGR